MGTVLVLNIRKRLPFQLAFRPTGATAGFEDAYNSYDYAIGGIPFLSGASPEHPLVRRSAEFRKQQIDQSPEPGEQSLTGWWVRSQSSWHGGAGLVYNEPSLDNSAPFRYFDAEGVDVWTPGQITLLKDTQAHATTVVPSTPFVMVGGKCGTFNILAWGNGTNSGMVVDGGADVTFTYDTVPTTSFQSIASDGKNVYLSALDGVWRAVIPTAPGPVVANKLWTFPLATSARLGWAKGRLMAGIGTKLFELVPPATGTAPYSLPTTVVYTSLISDWQWTSITAGPDAIYTSGFSGNRGTILKVAVDSAGALPVLTGATEVAQLPTGEWPLIARAYLGAFLVVGTNRGVRVADISTNGGIEYGPLIPTPQPVWDLVSRDKYVYATATAAFEDGNSGLLRVDLSLRHDNGRYAYAKDIKVPIPNVARSVALLGDSDRIAVALDSGGIYWEHLTNLVSQGYLQPGRIRYNTLWPKLFKRMNIRGTLVGSVVVSSIDDTGGEISLVTLGENSDLSSDLNISYPDRPQESLGIKLTLNRKSATAGPLLRGYQVKALPGGPRPHSYLIPVQCYDYEQTPNGVRSGYPGFALERLEALEALESSGQVVLFEDLRLDRQILVTIEEIEYRQTAPQGNNEERWGGVLTISLRTIAA